MSLCENQYLIFPASIGWRNSAEPDCGGWRGASPLTYRAFVNLASCYWQPVQAGGRLEVLTNKRERERTRATPGVRSVCGCTP